MADARSLLRSRRQDTRISHPLASYTAAEQLRCIACVVTIKNAAAWDGHIGSKAHRLAASELRKREQRNTEQTYLHSADKRDLSQVEAANNEEEHTEQATKRAKTEKRPESPERPSGTLPVDFFSNPSLAPVISSASDSDDDDTELQPPLPEKQTTVNSQLDLELQQFQASLLSMDSKPEENSEDAGRETYERATVFAEAEIRADIEEGIPPDVVSDTVDVTQGSGEKQIEAVTEGDKRLQQEQEDRELIMDRLIEEERAQEEADERVLHLKARIEALKRNRENKRSLKVQKNVLHST